MRVLAPSEIDEETMEEFLENLHPQGKIEEGYPIEAGIEDGEIDAGGCIAFNDMQR